MKITCLKEELLKKVVIASRLATARATLPILQNIYLEVRNNQLIIRSTDLEQTIEAAVEGRETEDGRVTTPARLLSDYLANTNGDEIKLHNQDLSLTIKGSSAQATIVGAAAEDYPQLPPTKYPQPIKLEGSTVKEIITKTLLAASSADSQPILNSLLWRFQDQSLTVVATDGYRLASYRYQIKQELTGDYLIPRRAAGELERILVVDQPVSVAFAANQVKFSVNGVDLTTRLLEGTFPSFEAIIPTKKTIRLKMSAAALNQGLKTASLFSRDSAFSTKLTLTAKTLTITAVSASYGQSTNTLPVELEGEGDFSVSINALYLTEALNHLDGPIYLDFLEGTKPLVITSPNKGGYLYLVMPLRSE